MNRAESPTRMGAKTSSPAWVFEKVLRAFETGDFTYADVLAHLRRLLATGASPTELLEILRRRELIEPLPESAHGVLDLLNDAIRRDAAEAVISAEAQDADPQAVAPDEEVMEERIARQHADYEALTRSYERTREAESAAAARAAALAADLAAARTALQSEQSKTREIDKALAVRIASTDAARARSEEAERESERYQTESHTLRDSLAAREATIVQVLHSLDERDAQLTALQQEYAKIVPALEARANSGTQLETDLRAARAGATALAADLAAARTALESEQSKTREIAKALAERIASTEAALAARDATIVQVRHSLSERDTQLAALQQEHTKIVPALEARAETGAQLEVDLQAALARADAISLELKVGQEAAAVLNAQLKRSESRLNAALTELGAVKTQSSSYLDLLRTREWRGGFDQNMFHELAARVEAADAARGALQAERDHLYAQVESLQRKLETQDALVDKAQSAANADSQRAAELHAAAQLRESEQAAKFAQLQAQQATQMAQLQSEQAAQFATVESARAARVAQLVPDAETREQESSALMEDSVAVGDVLMDRYRLVALVGEGDMSRVYKATDLDATTRVSPDSFIAVKVLTRPIDEEYVSFSSFQKLQGLAHPNIARIFDCDRDGSTVFITMEYLAGPSLYTKLHGGAAAGTPPSGLDREEARSIILGIADALDYAHRNDVVHGDLKPGNVIVIDRGEIKVIDFEIASWLARPKTALQRREAALQRTSPAPTPHYASPQLIAGQKPEPADDVYALACVAYELLTGTHPFDSGAGAQSLKFPPPRRAELSSAQYSALVHALQRDRSKRTPTVSQFVAEFTAPERGAASKPRAIVPAMALSAAVFVLAVVAWFFAHRAPVPTQVPAASSPAVPKPGTVIRDCPTCPAMTILPAGRITQGSARVERVSASFEKPLHWVIIRRPFAMSTNVVTVDDFQQFIAATGRDMQGCDTYDGEWKHRPKNSWLNPGFMQTGTHPVTCASWNDAEAYAQWLSTKTGRQYRLPSASEWEYAARAGSEAVQPWSPDGSGACANANVADESAAHEYPGWVVFACDDGYVHTAPVGSFKANLFGLNDMLGNVFQWTEDCWHADYTGAPMDGSARTDGNCSEHELRGGSWFSTPAYVRANYRNHFAADYRTSSVGIRLVRDLEQ